MSNTYSKISQSRLTTCHPELQRLFYKVLEEYDNSIVCGIRSKENQDEAFYNGYSKVQYPNSKHNKTPSNAVDVIPYPSGWEDTKEFYLFAGYVMRVAEELGINVRWGGLWSGKKGYVAKNSFNDLAHWELI